MTVSSIVDNATSSVVSRYPREAGPIVAQLKADLEARDEALVESLVSGGVALGARREQVEGLLTDAGLLATPEPEPTPEPTGEGSDDLSVIKASLASLSETVQSLVDFAKRHGL